MCGRFVSARKRLELLEEFAVERDRAGEDRNPDYNVAPTKQIYAVLDRSSSEDGGATERELRLVRWGLVPSWAKNASGGARLINARAETVAVKPAFRSAFARRRCLIPADGYYEWQPAAAGSKVKQPFYIYRTDSGILAFAGLYELWRDASVPADHLDAWLWTATIITTDAPDELGRIHDRMPMVIARDRWADWLDPANNDKELLHATLLPASAAGGLTSHTVSTAVNSVRNNGPELTEPLPAGDESGSAGPGSAGTRRPPLF
jgi:putative SOS response-associated peptidase YedK